MTNKNEVRVRFAPSPTGPLHMGGVRTALFNYFFAKQNKGIFILRIEDTDQARYVKGTEQYIIEALEWCGIKIDEGVNEGGNYGPYRQSERKDLYKQYAEQLLEKGDAYIAFDTPEELDRLRKEAEEKKETFTYDAQVRGNLNNSLNLSEEEVKSKIEKDDPYVVRYKMPENEVVEMNDVIRGNLRFQTSTLDDKVLFKSDGMPTYHLANIVDDHLMEISHVIRGEEWLPSLPLHVMLYKSLGWEETMPEFAHLPLLLKPTGKGKLSKRDGDKMGFPVFPLEWTGPDGETAMGYRESGYYPEAFVNLLALLGWNPGTEQEVFSMDQLIKSFSLEKVNKAGARFDPEKAKWFNHQYLIRKDNDQIASEFEKILLDKEIKTEKDKVIAIVGLVKERCSFVSDLWEQTSFFFEKPQEYDRKVIKKRWKENTAEELNKIKNMVVQLDDFDPATIEKVIKKYIQENELNMGQIMNSMRVSLVGGSKGPGLNDIIHILGKEEFAERIETAIETIEK